MSGHQPSAIRIGPLLDHPEVIPTLAAWFHREWHGFDGRSTACIAVQLQRNLQRDSLPITFLALRDGQLLGTASLDISDLPGSDHLSPWLASVYVDAPFRGQGVAHALVEHCQTFAQLRGVGFLHLWTAGATRLYERLGWRPFVTRSYAGRSISLLRIRLASE